MFNRNKTVMLLRTPFGEWNWVRSKRILIYKPTANIESINSMFANMMAFDTPKNRVKEAVNIVADNDPFLNNGYRYIYYRKAGK